MGPGDVIFHKLSQGTNMIISQMFQVKIIFLLSYMGVLYKQRRRSKEGGLIREFSGLTSMIPIPKYQPMSE